MLVLKEAFLAPSGVDQAAIYHRMGVVRCNVFQITNSSLFWATEKLHTRVFVGSLKIAYPRCYGPLNQVPEQDGAPELCRIAEDGAPDMFRAAETTYPSCVGHLKIKFNFFVEPKHTASAPGPKSFRCMGLSKTRIWSLFRIFDDTPAGSKYRHWYLRS